MHMSPTDSLRHPFRASLIGVFALACALCALPACDDGGTGQENDANDVVGSDTNNPPDIIGNDTSGGICERATPQCVDDTDCAPGSRCGFGPPCIPSSCCTYPDGSVECSGDCVPVCVSDTMTDSDGDGVPDDFDNCPLTPNPEQRDTDGDGRGDICESETCEVNAGCQFDMECPPDHLCGMDPLDCQPSLCCTDDATGEQWCTDDCVPQCVPVEGRDRDGDGVLDNEDNCPFVANPMQVDTDGNGVGDACQEMVECTVTEPTCKSNEDCAAGEICAVPVDRCVPSQCCFDPETGDEFCTDDCLSACIPSADPDTDRDGIVDSEDNCPETPNPDQIDTDGDGVGDACDPSECTNNTPCTTDLDCGSSDVCSSDGCHPSQCCVEPDGTEVCTRDCIDICIAGPDADGDGVTDSKDNCPGTANASQSDFDSDGIGDACDSSSCIHNRRCKRDDECAANQVCDDQQCAPSTCCLSGGSLVCTGDCSATCVLGPDADGDGVTDGKDNCPQTPNPMQVDSDGDGTGDACSMTMP